jgi:hypothetical protein
VRQISSSPFWAIRVIIERNMREGRGMIAEVVAAGQQGGLACG